MTASVEAIRHGDGVNRSDPMTIQFMSIVPILRILRRRQGRRVLSGLPWLQGRLGSPL
jgi:hypothetical protein